MVAELFMVTMTLAQLTPGEPNKVGVSRAGLDRVDALMQAEIHPGAVSAASILVARHGTILLHKGYGAKVEPDSVYIVASITKAHGGSVTAAPGPGRGTVFTVRLPLAGTSGPDDGSAGEPDRAFTADS